MVFSVISIVFLNKKKKSYLTIYNRHKVSWSMIDIRRFVYQLVFSNTFICLIYSWWAKNIQTRRLIIHAFIKKGYLHRYQSSNQCTNLLVFRGKTYSIENHNESSKAWPNMLGRIQENLLSTCDNLA
jgi:hypothetical protein